MKVLLIFPPLCLLVPVALIPVRAIKDREQQFWTAVAPSLLPTAVQDPTRFPFSLFLCPHFLAILLHPFAPEVFRAAFPFA